MTTLCVLCQENDTHHHFSEPKLHPTPEKFLIIEFGAGNENLKEVIGGAPCDVGLATPGGVIKLQERVVQLFIHLHDGCLVSAPVAVVGSTKNGHDTLLVGPVVARVRERPTE